MNHKETLRLPQSSFPLRVEPGQREMDVLAQWQERGLYQQRQQRWADAPALSLHDGPPYTYHKPQLRNAFNKILKDVWGRAGHMLGYRCDFVPGWDCHALPVTREVESRLGPEKDEMTPVAFRDACRAYVRDSIALQRGLFERLGVVADWERAYETMSPSYEAAVMRSLARMVRSDALVWRHQPVHWCGECATALAPFEIRYRKASSPSMYVGYPLISDPMSLDRALRGRDVEVVVWTASPWRIPGNQAIGLHRDAHYVAVRVHRRFYIVAEESLDEVAGACGWGKNIDVTVKLTGSALLGLRCRHPLIHRELPLVASSRVDPAVGSGCVQIAPAHNINDYALSQEANLELYCPIDEHGRFSPQVTSWAGMHFSEIGEKLLRQLQEWGALLNSPRHEIEHHAPHCRRCDQLTCQRSAPMWFLSMAHNELRERAIAAAEEVTWEPAWMGQQMTRELQHRGDWCLSRQRSWGIPLPVFYCKRCDRPWLNASMIDALAELYEQHPQGADAWYERSVEELLDAAGHSPRCPRCFLKSFRKEADVLDLWWEAGASFLTQKSPTASHEGSAASEDHAPDGKPTEPHARAGFDLYMEGTEQVESWFQSALLASVLLREQAPYDKVIGHAKVARKPRKPTPEEAAMWSPEALLERYGADVMRLWVILDAQQHQRPVMPTQLDLYARQWQKLRGMMRFLLGNLDGWRRDTGLVSVTSLEPFERLAMAQLQELIEVCHKAYKAGSYHSVWREVMLFVGRDLSRFACEVLKERLYCHAADAPARRSAQTFIYHCTHTIARLIAPICCFLSEEIWTHLRTHGNDAESADASSTVESSQHETPAAADSAGTEQATTPRGDVDSLPWSVHLTMLPGVDELPLLGSTSEPALLSWEQLRRLRRMAFRARRQLTPTAPGQALALELSIIQGDEGLGDALHDALASWPNEALAEVVGAASVVLSRHTPDDTASSTQPFYPLVQQLQLTWTALEDTACPRCRRLAGQSEREAMYCNRCEDAANDALAAHKDSHLNTSK